MNWLPSTVWYKWYGFYSRRRTKTKTCEKRAMKLRIWIFFIIYVTEWNSFSVFFHPHLILPTLCDELSFVCREAMTILRHRQKSFDSGGVKPPGTSHVMKIYRIGRKINIKHKNCHKNLLRKISPPISLIVVLTWATFCFRNFFSAPSLAVIKLRTGPKC